MDFSAFYRVVCQELCRKKICRTVRLNTLLYEWVVMTLRKINEVGGDKVEEALKALSVLIGYWFLARALVREIDFLSPKWWLDFVVPFVVSDWEFGVLLVFVVSPALLAVLGFVIYRPGAQWVRWAFAPMGVLIWIALMW